MTITLVILLLIYVFYFIIKWSLKFAILLLLVMGALGFFYKVGITQKITEVGEYLKNHLHSK